MKHIDSIDPIKELKKRQGNLTLRKFAATIPCSPAYLSDIYNYRRAPGKIILDYLGLSKSTEKRTLYWRVK